MTQNSQALAIFEQARKLYLQEQFDQARERMAVYRQSIDYDCFPRQDRRLQKPVHSSVIIVSFGTGPALLQCLESVFNQTDKELEVILVDNGGNEAVHPQLANFPLLWVSAPINLLPSEGRNVGTHFARGDRLIFLDDDAIMDSGYVSHARAVMERDEFLALRGKIAPKTNPPEASPPPHYDLGERPIPAVLVTEGNMVIQHQAFISVGGFDPLLFGHEGVELTSRCLEKFPNRGIYYWPNLVIYHDFASGERQQAKKARQALAVEYLKAVSPSATSLPATYRKRYALCTEGSIVERARAKQEKAMSDQGVSIIIRAGEEIGPVEKFLDSFVRHNTHKPVEIVMPAAKPQEALSVIRPFIPRVFIRLVPPRTLSAQTPLSQVAETVRYSQILLLDESAIFERDILPELLKRLTVDKVSAVSNCVDQLSSSLFCSRETLYGLENVSADIPIQELAEQIRVHVKLEPHVNRTQIKKIAKILFIGPWQFLEDTGYKNVKLIYPSLFEPLNDCEFHILHGKPDLPIFTDELVEKFGVTFHQVETRRDEDWIARAIEVVKKENIDILTNVFFGYHFGYIAAKAAKECKQLSVVRFPANEIYAKECGGAYNNQAGKNKKAIDIKKEREAINLANKVIAISPWEEKRLKNLAQEKGQIEWCMRGIDTDKYSPPKKTESEPAKKFIYAGRKSFAKGHHLIEEVAAEIQNEYPQIEFYFAGQFDNDKKNNITYLGYLSPEELRKVYAEMDALILPSMSEGFANVIIEAMAMGLPCLITREIHESYFTHKKNALLIDLNKESIKENILTLHNDRNLFNQLRRESRKLAVQEFNAVKWQAKYRSLILDSLDLKAQAVDAQFSSSRKKVEKSDLKILFISSRPFGLMGTPGTYLLVDTYEKLSNVCLISNKDNRDEFKIVYSLPPKSQFHEVSFESKDYHERILEIAKSFQPDLIVVTSYANWFVLVDHLKRLMPHPKYVLDIKSPLLADPNSQRAKRIRSRGQESSSHLDLVMTRSHEDIQTLIPNCNVPTLIYPLGIELKCYEPKTLQHSLIFCKRFVYIGSISPLRKLDVLLRYIDNLPNHIRSELTFDFYGSGPYEQKFIEEIHRLKLNDTVFFKGCVDASTLPKILSKYDAGIAWVPHERYDSAPSLKLVEYTAAGLLPIATDTTAHRKFADEGFHCVLFSDTSESFASAIEDAYTNGFDRVKRENNLRFIKERDWLNIVEKKILPCFLNLVNKEKISNDQQFNLNQNKNKKLSRLFVISPRPFGLVSTAGTYLLADAYASLVDTYVVCKKDTGAESRVVYQPKNISNIYAMDFNYAKFLQDLSVLVHQFKPQIVILFNYVNWHRIIAHLKNEFPDIKFVLDIQTPLIIENDIDRYKKIQRQGARYGYLLDLVLTLTLEAIPTWIPNWSGKAYQYPLGIQIEQYKPASIQGSAIYCRRFVFIGSLHKLRKLDRLISYIAALPEYIKQEVIFDFYGHGSAFDELNLLVKQLNLESTVSFKGLVDSQQVAQLLSEYDAGIAWVPYDIFDYSPSLKLLEYIAAGIVPVATDTIAHKRDVENGLEVELFSDAQISFHTCISNLFNNGFPVERRDNNLKKIAEYDYLEIAKKNIFPILNEVLNITSNGYQLNNRRKSS